METDPVFLRKVIHCLTEMADGYEGCIDRSIIYSREEKAQIFRIAAKIVGEERKKKLG